MARLNRLVCPGMFAAMNRCWKFLFVSVLPCGLLFGGIASGQNPVPASTAQAIVGGEAESGFDAVASLIGSTGATSTWQCTAMLVSPKVAITAAHCVMDQDGTVATSIQLLFGPSNADLFESATVTAIHPHPDYVGFTNNDIAVVVLASAVDVVPMAWRWWPIGDSWVSQQDMFAVGFGVTGDNSNDSGVKRSVSIPLYNLSTTSVLTDIGTTGTCYGDSGGPIFHWEGDRWVSWGVASWAVGGCTGLGTHTRVDAYADWIVEIIADAEGTDDMCAAAQMYEDGVCDEICDALDPDCVDASGCTCSATDQKARHRWFAAAFVLSLLLYFRRTDLRF